MLQRALRLRPPQLVSGNLHYPQAVGFLANFVHDYFLPCVAVHRAASATVADAGIDGCEQTEGGPVEFTPAAGRHRHEPVMDEAPRPPPAAARGRCGPG